MCSLSDISKFPPTVVFPFYIPIRNGWDCLLSCSITRIRAILNHLIGFFFKWRLSLVLIYTSIIANEVLFLSWVLFLFLFLWIVCSYLLTTFPILFFLSFKSSLHTWEIALCLWYKLNGFSSGFSFVFFLFLCYLFSAVLKFSILM